MRDAFGGLFMIRLLLVFIFIYIIFAAISFNYAQAFRLKNDIISYIEENDIVDFEKVLTLSDDTTLKKLDEIISKYSYTGTCDGKESTIESKPLSPKEICYHGIYLTASEKDNIVTYNVKTLVYMNLPLINRFYMHAANSDENYEEKNPSFIQIHGEAKVVKRTAPPKEDKEET